MANIFKFLFITLTSISILAHSLAYNVKLKCKFEVNLWLAAGNVYICNVQNNGIFDGTRVTIDSVEGEHMSGYSNIDVNAIVIEYITNISYFPVYMEKHFKNLIIIEIANSQLKEINKNDLQPFPNLKYLHLSGNDIKIIEKDTFKYNQHLIGIFLSGNQITHIDDEVFSELYHLERLYLSNNKCKKLMSDAWTKLNTQKVIEMVEAGDCNEINHVDKKLTTKFNGIKIEGEKIDSELTTKFKAQDEIYKKEFSEIEVKFSTLIIKMDQKDQETSNRIEILTTENHQLKSDVIALKSKNEELKLMVKNLQNDDIQLEAQIQALKGENLKKIEEKLEIEVMKKDLAVVTSKVIETNRNLIEFQSDFKAITDNCVNIKDYENIHTQFRTLSDEIRNFTSKFEDMINIFTDDIKEKHVFDLRIQNIMKKSTNTKN